MKINLFEPYIDDAEEKAVLETLRSKFWASGAGAGNVAKFENNSDLQQFEKYASNLIDQLRKTFTFREGGFPGVMIFNYEGEAALEAIDLS